MKKQTVFSVQQKTTDQLLDGFIMKSERLRKEKRNDLLERKRRLLRMAKGGENKNDEDTETIMQIDHQFKKDEGSEQKVA